MRSRSFLLSQNFKEINFLKKKKLVFSITMPIKHAILIKILRCFFRLHANYTFFLSFEKKEKGAKIFLKGDRRSCLFPRSTRLFSFAHVWVTSTSSSSVSGCCLESNRRGISAGQFLVAPSTRIPIRRF